MAGIAGVKALPPGLSRSFPLWRGGLFVWSEGYLPLFWEDWS